ncbi:MAG: restriction endonuclease, partial [Chryseobacterium sp.]
MSDFPEWYNFQEEIKQYFISIGADARTNIRIEGIRTAHNIDVYVETRFLGEDLVWLVEAKYWKKKVNKSHVLAFRTIVEDIGADRGFLVSKAGFQRGALEAAINTNVKLRSLAEMKTETKGMVENDILKTFSKRLTIIEDRYWAHSKTIRIKYQLRHDVGDWDLNFVGQQLLVTARKALLAAVERQYPIDVDAYFKEQKGEAIVHNFQQLSNWINLNLNHFEEKLLIAEWEMYRND